MSTQLEFPLNVPSRVGQYAFLPSRKVFFPVEKDWVKKVCLWLLDQGDYRIDPLHEVVYYTRDDVLLREGNKKICISDERVEAFRDVGVPSERRASRVQASTKKQRTYIDM